MKTMLVLGANSDIAKETIKKFAKESYHFILCGRNIDSLTEFKTTLENQHAVKVSVKEFDAMKLEDIARFYEECKKEYTEIHGLFLAYGYLGDQKEAEKSIKETERILITNFASCVYILNLFANYFEEKKSGFIYVISSVAGDRGRQSNYLYGASKGGLSLYLQGLRNRLYPSNVHVMTIKPGFVMTKMTKGMLKNSPLVATPEKIGHLIYKAAKKQKNTAYLPSFWGLIMTMIKMIPEFIFKKLKL